MSGGGEDAGRTPLGRAPAWPASGPEAAKAVEVLWWPYRPVAGALLGAHRDARAMMAANRALADALGTIMRREQDLLAELAEGRPLPDGTPADGLADDATRVERRFDAAIAALRELSQAVLDAQIRSLEAMRAEAAATVAARPRRAEDRDQAMKD